MQLFTVHDCNASTLHLYWNNHETATVQEFIQHQLKQCSTKKKPPRSEQAHFEAGFFMIRFTFGLAHRTVLPIDDPAVSSSSFLTSCRQSPSSPLKLGILL
jgi:hypothetical protein